MCYNGSRDQTQNPLWFAWLRLLAIGLILFSSPAISAELVVPKLSEFKEMPRSMQERVSKQFGYDNIGPLIESGILVPGDRLDLDNPYFAFIVQFNKWRLKSSEAVAPDSVDYQELLEWKKVKKKFNKLDKFLENNRKFGWSR